VASFGRVVEHHRECADHVGPYGVPSLIGETGIPQDLSDGDAYVTGDFSKQCWALDTVLAAVESRFCSFTLWCYTAENTNERGDQWNGEDFSCWSKDQVTDTDDLNSGGRALPALVRPYALRTAGTPLRQKFDTFSKHRMWDYRYSSRDFKHVTAPTVIFVPQFQYVKQEWLNIRVSDGYYELDWEAQTVSWWHNPKRNMHRILISLRKGDERWTFLPPTATRRPSRRPTAVTQSAGEPYLDESYHYTTQPSTNHAASDPSSGSPFRPSIYPPPPSARSSSRPSP